MRIPGSGEKARESSNFVAAEAAGEHADEAVARLEQAVGVDWYRRHGTEVDHAALELCLLRRARAGEKGAPEAGDDAVRAVLAEARPEAVLWLASRAVSYMDETGFPEAVRPWFPEGDEV